MCFNLIVLMSFFLNAVEKNEVTDDMIMQISSLLVPRPQTRSRYDVPFRGDEYRYENKILFYFIIFLVKI